MITSVANAQIRHLIQLRDKPKIRKKEGIFLVEGHKMLEEAYQFGKIQKIYVSEQCEIKEVSQMAPCEICSDAVFKQLSDTMTPQGVLAVVQQPIYTLAELTKNDKIRLLILENIRDPGNLGTMIRTAEGAGMNGVILTQESVDIFNPKVIRSTMGSIFRMPFYYTTDLKETLINLREQGILFYAACLKATHHYDEMKYAKKSGILIGNEAAGLCEETIELADKLVKIPMCGKVESLNAAIAAALLMYQTRRE